MVVSEIWRYPVKSMIGEQVPSIELNELGLVGDRVWATRDLERGGIRGAKKIGELMSFTARGGTDDHVIITFPDGAEMSTSDRHLDEAISNALGRRVRLESLRPSDDLEHYRRGAPDHADLMDELRAVFGRDHDEPLPDFSVFPPEVAEFESPPGTYYDCFPLMVLTTSAISALTAALPDSVIDVRRFRPSFVVDTDGAPGHPEFGWAGRTASIGTAVVEFGDPCPRCVMVTRAVGPNIPADRAVLRHIVAELDQNLGVYGRITRPGVVSLGDNLLWQD